MRAARNPVAGFTLVELVVTLTLTAIVMSFASLIVSGPAGGFMDQTRRARLVDAADSALERIGRDIRRALPNSIRTGGSGGVVALELLGSVDGARYRTMPPGTDAQILDFAGPDASFNVLGPFTQLAKPWSSTAHYLAIYNVGVPGADAFELANVMTPPGTTLTIAADGATGEDRVTLAPAFRFAYGSPTQRVFLVDGPVSYLCDPVAGTLLRYQGYTIAAAHAARDAHGELLAAGAIPSLMTTGISACAIAYTPGTAERAGLVTIELTVTAQGESISLLAQVHVDNVP